MSGSVRAFRLRSTWGRVATPPPGEEREIGVVLYPTIFGLNAAMDGFAADLASAGFTVLAWDPYDGEQLPVDTMAVVARSKLIEDTRCLDALGDIADHMGAEFGFGRIGGIGWCFGGRIGLLHAGGDPRIAALCSYNPTILPSEPMQVTGAGTICRTDCPGQTIDDFEMASRIAGPVQVTRPGHDFTQPDEYRRLVDALFARSSPTFYEYYPLVGHGFSYTPGEANESARRYAWSNTRQMLAGLAAS